MRTARGVLLVLAALAVSGTAMLPVGLAAAKPPTIVHVAGQVAGFLPAPCNCSVVVFLAVSAQGGATSLEGSGIGHATTGATNHFSLTGSTDGDLVDLLGSVVKSTSPPIEGSPVHIEADTTTGEVTFTLGPLAGGPFVGQTFVFVGSGTVVVAND